MPDIVGIQVRKTLENPGNFPHECVGLGRRLLERISLNVLTRAHPSIIGRGARLGLWRRGKGPG